MNLDSNLIIAAAIVIIIWLVVLTILLARALSHYQSLTKGVAKKDLISSLNHLVGQTKQNQEDLKNLVDRVDIEVNNNRKHLQKVGFLRFNPFTDTGGNQTFCLSLLDENGDGIVISSLHSRENTRLYSKKIEAGHCVAQVLSKEEEQVVKQALK